MPAPPRLALLVALSVLAVVGGCRTAAPGGEGAGARAVFDTLDGIAEAGAARDLPALERLYAPGYVHTNADGSRLTRAAVLDGYRRAPEGGGPRLLHDEDAVDYLDGGTAVVSRRVWTEASGDGVAPQRFRVTYVLVRAGGAWRLVASHAAVVLP